MPFRSPEQRTYLKHNQPTIYKRWVAEHGTKVVPKRKKKSSKKAR